MQLCFVLFEGRFHCSELFLLHCFIERPSSPYACVMTNLTMGILDLSSHPNVRAKCQINQLE